MKSLGPEQAVVHKRLVLGFVVRGMEATSVGDEPGFMTMLRGFAKSNNLEKKSRPKYCFVTCRRIGHRSEGGAEAIAARSAHQPHMQWLDVWQREMLIMMGTTAVHWQMLYGIV